MKLLNILVIVLIGFFVASCQNDAKVENDNQTMIVVKDTSLVESVPDKEPKKIEKKESKKLIVKKNKETIIRNNSDENIIAEVEEPEQGGINMREETAADLEKEVNQKVNRVVNPDNDNGSFEIKEDATISVIPVITAEDKEKYYVQFKIKVTKLSKSDLSKFFPDSQKIYVVQHQGLYKYSVGQFDNEEDAIEYKKQVDKEFGFKNSEVTSYSDAW